MIYYRSGVEGSNALIFIIITQKGSNISELIPKRLLILKIAYNKIEVWEGKKLWLLQNLYQHQFVG